MVDSPTPEPRQPSHHCPYCGVDGQKDDLFDAIDKLKFCTNCVVDMMQDGKWTGHGKQAMQDLVARFGLESVLGMWDNYDTIAALKNKG